MSSAVVAETFEATGTILFIEGKGFAIFLTEISSTQTDLELPSHPFAQKYKGCPPSFNFDASEVSPEILLL